MADTATVFALKLLAIAAMPVIVFLIMRYGLGIK
jgi:hypothetical protein